MNDRLFSLPEKLIAEYQTRDPFSIAHAKGFSVKFLDMKKQKGFCMNIYNNFFIFINDNMSDQMKRMTCAHELGHILLHPGLLGKGPDGKLGKLVEMELFDITDSTEYEANVFAANLLIDTDEMMGYLTDGADIVSAAGALNVNVNLLAIRLTEMRGLNPDLPFTVNNRFLGRIKDSADSIG